MSEIPEHLLKRSRSAKASKSGEDGGSEDATPVAASSNAPAAAAPAAAAVPANLPNLDPAPVPAKPDAPYVVASKARRRIPVWALPVVAALPIWAIAYPGTLQQPAVEDPLFVEGALFYNGACAGCHGAGGGGGTGYPLSNGSVLETFPNPIDQMVHVARGSASIEGQEYGAPREDLGGRRVAGAKGSGQMPPHLELTEVELEMIIFHERVDLSGEKTDAPEYEAWMESMRTRYEAGDTSLVDLDLLLACADPAITPGATGTGAPDPDNHPCPGPAPAGSTETAAG